MLVLVNAPLVAPVSVKSAAVNPVTSALKVKVSAVVLTELLVPFIIIFSRVILSLGLRFQSIVVVVSVWFLT